MKAVMYGAGNIGRGFIGALLSQSGYTVTFIDISQVVVENLNQNHSYPIRIVSNEGHEDIEISGVDAVHGSGTHAVAKAIACADIMAISVGANVLPHIIPNLLAGLRLRWESNTTPLNILLCENLMDVNKVMEKLLKNELAPNEFSLLDEKVGLVETSIGRMVPVQTLEMQAGNPMRICVEPYGFLPVDRNAFKGEIPPIQKLVPFSPFHFYLKRKLYLHNMSHAICAYLGMYNGQAFIHEAIEDANIRLIVKEAMCESIITLSEEYYVPMRDLLLHADDLLIRFTNSALGDTCSRVGADPARKLGPSDRFIGSALFCMSRDVLPIGIAAGAAGAVYQYLNEKELLQKDENAAAALFDLANLQAKSELADMILDFYQMYRRGTNPKQLFQAIEARKKLSMMEVV